MIIHVYPKIYLIPIEEIKQSNLRSLDLTEHFYSSALYQNGFGLI